jgi:hypothetical protein
LLEHNHTARKMSEVLATKFPTGTTEARLVQELRREGFEFPPPPPNNCIPRGETPSAGRVVSCYDPTKMLEYTWSIGLVCRNFITLRWSTDSDAKITRLEGFFNPGCL